MPSCVIPTCKNAVGLKKKQDGITFHVSKLSLPTMKINETFSVGSFFDCNTIPSDHESFFHSTLWRQTIVGCRILKLLQDIYGFNMTYVIQKESYNLTAEILSYNYKSKTVDIFARPMTLRKDVLDLATPIQDVLDWNFGFILQKSQSLMPFQSFYSKPFVRPLWNCLYLMAAICIIFFYCLNLWERKMIKQKKSECSISHEMLIVIGAYCQHIPPIEAVLYSRRTAYLTFLLFAYIVYTFYTSNLLSHLVNDKDDTITLDVLLESDYNCLILDYFDRIIGNSLSANVLSNASTIYNKLINMKHVSLLEGLEAVKTTKAALFSDYVALTPLFNEVFTGHEICQLIRINVFSTIKKYFFVSKTFPYKEYFKIATLRAREVGILGKILSYEFFQVSCNETPNVQAGFSQISALLYLLLSSYVLSIIILIIEIIHFKRTTPWPYVD